MAGGVGRVGVRLGVKLGVKLEVQVGKGVGDSNEVLVNADGVNGSKVG